MADPRLNGAHLSIARFDQYEATVNEVIDYRGPATADLDPLVRRPSQVHNPLRKGAPPPWGTYCLVRQSDGCRFVLREGINAIGRFAENDIVLTPNHVSRRHCIVLVHATGACEVYDTASRNGTSVNRQRIGRVVLLPGDILSVTDLRFLVVWIGANGEMRPSHEESSSSSLEASTWF
jgi:hypothetical protein